MFDLKVLILKLKNLQVGKAMGRDGISGTVLRNCGEELIRVLQKIFRKSYNDGEIPEEWREANVTPIFKSVNKLSA